jgi:hypothetical protein
MLPMRHYVFLHQAQYLMSVDFAMHKVCTTATSRMPTNQLCGIVGQSWLQSTIVST